MKKGQQKNPVLFFHQSSMLYGFGGMSPLNHQERLVKNDTINGIEFDTCFAYDTGCYETGIVDKRYHDCWIIVEEYDTKKEALAGHKKWIKKLTIGKPPKELSSVQGDYFNKLLKD